MELFPTQYSTLSSVALKHRIEKDYGFSGLSCKFLQRGVSDTYMLSNQTDKYILKIFRTVHRTKEEISGEIALLELLRKKGAKVSYALQDLHGNSIQAFNAAEGRRYGVVYTFAKGQRETILSDAQLKVLAHEMAFQHNILADARVPYPRPVYTAATTVWEPLRVLEPMFNEYGYTTEYEWLKTAAADVLRNLEALQPQHFSRGYCHFDYFPHNYFFDEQNGITVFDFDFAGEGYLAYDPASLYTFYVMLLSMKRITAADFQHSMQWFITHYRQVRSFSDDEVKALPLLGFMLLLRYLQFQYETYDDYTHHYFNPRFVKERIGLLQQLLEQPVMQSQ
ncbi:phosphotransferase enzyme family protein [Chitinophaga vietnamensis]|uniref:phosphotransferase enzyme family protein n=1 Tax=Chitinophaga vietnamensis TaxID=2593957 RepID=UPI0011774950|nr:phosphotransferase [Chitinophaga vietnamensis]